MRVGSTLQEACAVGIEHYTLARFVNRSALFGPLVEVIATALRAAAVSQRMKTKSSVPFAARTVITGILLFIAASICGAAESTVSVSKITLRTPGGPLRAEVFEKPDRQRRPAILVLHGAGGTLLDGPEMRRVARHLAAAGNAVYLVRYFERTGTLFARDAAMQKNFSVWLRAVRESVTAVQELRGDPLPVGIYGYSLGGFLALFAASDNPQVGAVAEHAGGVWNEKMDRIGKMPPVLMIHGERDERVPFQKYARPLVPVLRARAKSVETRFFAEEGHVFSAAAMIEVRENAAKFFKRNLSAR